MRTSAFAHAGVLISHFDGHRSDEQPWLPSADETRRGLMSASLIFGQLHRSFSRIPLFSYDSGVVLRPAAVTPLCMYGNDAATDRLPVCGDSAMPWCTASDLPAGTSPSATRVCGFDFLRNWRSGLNPWHVEQAPAVLEHQSVRGQGDATPPFTGYNEVVVAPWDESAIEFFFLVECADDEPNRRVPAQWMDDALARTCEEAHSAGRRAHAAFLRAHGVSSTSFPLLMLRRGDWTQPFAVSG